MDRSQALSKIITALRRIDGRTSPWNPSYTFNEAVYDQVYSRDLFLDEINSFPCVMCVAERVTVKHTGGGQRYNILQFRIRGVTWNNQVEDAGELLAEDIEHVFTHIRQDHPMFDEIRLDSIQTDEGLNAPLGAVILEGTALYRND